jgi:enoyl-CoA hydratase/carnithine racemase
VSPSATSQTWSFDTLNVRADGGVLFVEIAAPPMNLLGPELVRDLVALIKDAEGDPSVKVLVFSSADPSYFISRCRVPSSRTSSRRSRAGSPRFQPLAAPQ